MQVKEWRSKTSIHKEKFKKDFGVQVEHPKASFQITPLQNTNLTCCGPISSRSVSSCSFSDRGCPAARASCATVGWKWFCIVWVGEEGREVNNLKCSTFHQDETPFPNHRFIVSSWISTQLYFCGYLESKFIFQRCRVRNCFHLYLPQRALQCMALHWIIFIHQVWIFLQI